VHGSRQVDVFDWLATIGVRITAPTWHLQERAVGDETQGLAHAVASCRAGGRGAVDTGTARIGFAQMAESHYFCQTCLPQALDPGLAPTAAADLFREVHALRRLSTMIEQAGSTFHVIVGRDYPALHGAVVEQVRNGIAPELAKPATHPLHRRLQRILSERLDAVSTALPYDEDAALGEAVLLAARWRFEQFRANDLFRRGLKHHSDWVRELGDVLSRSVTRTGQAHEVAEALLTGNAALAAELPVLGEILRSWADVIDGALRDDAPTFFACGGIPGMVGAPLAVPRTANGWIARQGIRVSRHHWGLGEMPKVLLEYVAWSCRNSELHGNIEIIDTAHEHLSEDAWQTAGALWTEHMNLRRNETLYANPGEAILAAARL